MSRWLKIQQSQEIFPHIEQIYSGNQSLPIEARHFFADWLEAQPWSEIQEDDPSHVAVAGEMLFMLIKMMEIKATSETDQLFVKLKLREIANHLKNTYENNPMEFVRLVRTCLETEEVLLQQAESAGQVVVEERSATEQAHAKIGRDLEILASKTAIIEQEVTKMKEEQEAYVIHYQDKSNTIEKIHGLEVRIQQNQVNNLQEHQNRKQELLQRKQQLEQYLREKANFLLNYRIKLADVLVETVAMLHEVQNTVLDKELVQWQMNQKLAGNGFSFDTVNHLTSIQNWCEKLADLEWRIRQQIKQLDLIRMQLHIDMPEGQANHLPDLMIRITSLISSLVTQAFIVENQPPQVLKKDAKFSSSVRLLIGGKLTVHMNPPEVKASIISESQARGLMNSDDLKNETCGTILNNTGTMQYEQSSGKLRIDFRNMQLKKIKRADKKGTDCVTEEKFCILFQSEFNVGGKELTFRVYIMSLPVVVTVHGNQDPKAQGTVLWDNAFSEHKRIAFQVPESVPWVKLAEQLNMKFQAGTGRGLTASNIQYLASKIFNESVNEDYSHRMVSWNQFNKDHVPNRNFTFWMWFHDMYKLTTSHLEKQWKDGSIVGFISKAQAQEDLLKSQTNGTFLLRFSDSESGGLTVAWVNQRPDSGQLEVYNLTPFTSQDFKIRELSDRLKDLNNLVYLYPNIPKEQAFGKYCTPQGAEQLEQTKDGYIKSNLVNVISWNTKSMIMNMDNPATPPLPWVVSSPSYGSPPPSNISDRLSPEIGAESLDNTMQFDYTPDDIDNVELFTKYLQ